MFIDNKGNTMLTAQELKAIIDAESSPPSKPSPYISSDLEHSQKHVHKFCGAEMQDW